MFPSWMFELQWMFATFAMVVYKLISCPQFEKMDLKTIVTVGCCKTKEYSGPEVFFWKTTSRLTSDKQMTHTQLSQSKKLLWPIQLLFCLRNYMWTSVVWNSLFSSMQFAWFIYILVYDYYCASIVIQTVIGLETVSLRWFLTSLPDQVTPTFRPCFPLSFW